jgi:hypothetical protein
MTIYADKVFQTAMYSPVRFPRRRFTLRADGGFLAACTSRSGPPIAVVPDYLDAVLFVDFDAAQTRARLMAELGWSGLRIVEVTLD